MEEFEVNKSFPLLLLKTFERIGFEPRVVQKISHGWKFNSPFNPHERTPSFVFYESLSDTHGNFYDYSEARNVHYTYLSLILDYLYDIDPSTPFDNPIRKKYAIKELRYLYPDKWNNQKNNDYEARKFNLSLNNHKYIHPSQSEINKQNLAFECSKLSNNIHVPNSWYSQFEIVSVPENLQNNKGYSFLKTRNIQDTTINKYLNDKTVLLLDENHEYNEIPLFNKYKTYYPLGFVRNYYLPNIEVPFPAGFSFRNCSVNTLDYPKELAKNELEFANGFKLNSTKIPFGLSGYECCKDKIVWIMEGPLDAISCKEIEERVGHHNQDYCFLSIGSTSSYSFETLRYIKDCKELVVFTDNDTAGDYCANKIAKDAATCAIKKINRLVVSDNEGNKVKDANDCLQYIVNNQPLRAMIKKDETNININFIDLFNGVQAL